MKVNMKYKGSKLILIQDKELDKIIQEGDSVKLFIKDDIKSFSILNIKTLHFIMSPMCNDFELIMTGMYLHKENFSLGDVIITITE